MKRVLVLLAGVALLAGCMSTASATSDSGAATAAGSSPTATHAGGSQTFVEEPILEGKAIIYVYLGGNYALSQLVTPKPWAQALVLTTDGQFAALPQQHYCALTADPGRVELLLVAGSGGQYGSGMLAKKLVFEATSGQAVFVSFRDGVMAARDAKSEILGCVKVE